MYVAGRSWGQSPTITHVVTTHVVTMELFDTSFAPGTGFGHYLDPIPIAGIWECRG